jgi:hypothetical protein
VIQLLATLAGFAFASYRVLFRLDALQAKYGRLDLIFWFWAVIFVFGFCGWIVDLLIWLGEYVYWTIVYGDPD